MIAKRHTLVNALYTAADTYDYCAKTSPELGVQFSKQAAEARQLAERIEQGDTIRLED